MQGQIYLVGGAIRDELLGIPVHERDWVVVGATPQQMLAAGYRQRDPDFPVFLHPDSGEEYALARREFKVGEGYRGFEVDISPEVSLQEDLARRDLTVNAMARSESGELIDPFDGQADLQQGLLRHVTPAFVEDPLRVLRVARFAAKLGGGFHVAHATHRLMKQMIAEGAMQQLQPQRVWQEMRKALACAEPWRFFEVLAACGALAHWLPLLAASMQAPAHAEGQQAEAIGALKRACAASTCVDVRLAALLLASGDQAQQGLPMERRTQELLGAATQAWEHWQTKPHKDAAALLALFNALRAWQAGDARCDQVMTVLAALTAHGELELLQRALAAAREVSAASLVEQGLQGAALGQALQQARQTALQEVLNAD